MGSYFTPVYALARKMQSFNLNIQVVMHWGDWTLLDRCHPIRIADFSRPPCAVNMKGMRFLVRFLKVDSVPLAVKDWVANIFRSPFFAGVQHIQFSAAGSRTEIRFLQTLFSTQQTLACKYVDCFAFFPIHQIFVNSLVKYRWSSSKSESTEGQPRWC